MNTKSYVVHSTTIDEVDFTSGGKSALALVLVLLVNLLATPVIGLADASTAASEKPTSLTNGKMVNPSQALSNIQTAIDDLSRANQAKMFSIKPQDSSDLATALAGIQKKVAAVQVKYQAKPTPASINEREIYKEIEISLSAKELAAIDTMRSLQYKKGVSIQQYSPDPSQCANHCEKTCGYDGVGNKVCWFTCYYCCGHGGC